MISGPSGVGKDTLMEIIEKRNPEKIHIAITATTRKPRSNEINGVNHFFVNSCLLYTSPSPRDRG